MFCPKCGKEGDWKKPLCICDDCRAIDPDDTAKSEKLYADLWDNVLKKFDGRRPNPKSRKQLRKKAALTELEDRKKESK